MPVHVCSVSFKSPTGIAHSAEVEAETLYEAAGMGLARLKKDGWIEGWGPGQVLRLRPGWRAGDAALVPFSRFSAGSAASRPAPRKACDVRGASSYLARDFRAVLSASASRQTLIFPARSSMSEQRSLRPFMTGFSGRWPTADTASIT